MAAVSLDAIELRTPDRSVAIGAITRAFGLHRESLITRKDEPSSSEQPFFNSSFSDVPIFRVRSSIIGDETRHLAILSPSLLGVKSLEAIKRQIERGLKAEKRMNRVARVLEALNLC